jgi:hypothetical protein
LFVPGVAAEKSNENIQPCYIFYKEELFGIKINYKKKWLEIAVFLFLFCISTSRKYHPI